MIDSALNMIQTQGTDQLSRNPVKFVRNVYPSQDAVHDDWRYEHWQAVEDWTVDWERFNNTVTTQL